MAITARLPSSTYEALRKPAPLEQASSVLLSMSRQWHWSGFTVPFANTPHLLQAGFLGPLHPPSAKHPDQVQPQFTDLGVQELTVAPIPDLQHSTDAEVSVNRWSLTLLTAFTLPHHDGWVVSVTPDHRGHALDISSGITACTCSLNQRFMQFRRTCGKDQTIGSNRLPST